MIYFIRGQTTHAIKIGLASAPAKRLAMLQTGSSELLEIIATMQGDRGIENHLHTRFQAFHIRGEWFRGERSLLDAIRLLTGPGWLLGDPLMVADHCRHRGNCRYGLGGLRMQHVPSGREFICTRTYHDRNNDLRLIDEPYPDSIVQRGEILKNAAKRLGEGTAEYLQTVENLDELGLVCLADVTARPMPESMSAEECVLLEDWPITCCKPSISH